MANNRAKGRYALSVEEIMETIKKKTKYDGECWRFTGSHNEKGYGKITYQNKCVRVSRVVAHIHYGTPIEGYLDPFREVCHTKDCKFRDCWRPDHLYIGSHKENMRDIHAK